MPSGAALFRSFTYRIYSSGTKDLTMRQPLKDYFTIPCFGHTQHSDSVVCPSSQAWIKQAETPLNRIGSHFPKGKPQSHRIIEGCHPSHIYTQET